MPSSMQATIENEQAVWHSLRQAIAASSGFQRWQKTQSSTETANLVAETQDEQVQRYLRETLATLAY